MTTYKFGFIIEQALGHVTHTQNLQRNVPRDPDVEPFWGLVPWETQGLAGRIPIYKSNWTVRAGLRARRAVAGIARQTRLDALFFHTQVPAVLSNNWLRRFPSIVSLDATPIQYNAFGGFYNHHPGSAWFEHLKWKLNRDCFRAARQLVAWSEWAKQGVVNDYEVSSEKVIVIPPGVTAADWTCPIPRRPHDRPVKILFVGADLERKGGLLLLEAFRALRPIGVELHMVTRASLPEEPGLFVYNQMQPNSSALKQLYYESDIFCLPTYADCLPMVLSEAGAAGLPVISTRVAGIPEIVEDGTTGFIVPPGDVPALVHALKALVRNPQLRLVQGERAVDVVTREFDAQRNARRLLTLMKQVADSSRVQRKAA
jgi:glycosyltransferase involved in cell wall biosynthesis